MIQNDLVWVYRELKNKIMLNRDGYTKNQFLIKDNAGNTLFSIINFQNRLLFGKKEGDFGNKWTTIEDYPSLLKISKNHNVPTITNEEFNLVNNKQPL